MAAKVDVAKLSDAELADLAEAVGKEQARRKEIARAAALATIKEVAAGVGMTVGELLASQGKQRAGPKGEPKYRNPDNPDQTWTGKGTRQGWFVAAQERGITREEMLI